MSISLRRRTPSVGPLFATTWPRRDRCRQSGFTIPSRPERTEHECHDRAVAQVLGDPAQLGALEEATTRPRGHRVLDPAYPGFEVEVEALNADPAPVEAVTIPAIVEHFESVISELDEAADPDRTLGGRRVHPAAARPRARRGRRRAQLGAHRGRAGGAAVPGQVHVPGAAQPGQPAQGRALRLRAVELRVHQHLPGGRGPPALRALRRPGVRADPVRERAGAGQPPGRPGSPSGAPPPARGAPPGAPPRLPGS